MAVCAAELVQHVHHSFAAQRSVRCWVAKLCCHSTGTIGWLAFHLGRPSIQAISRKPTLYAHSPCQDFVSRARLPTPRSGLFRASSAISKSRHILARALRCSVFPNTVGRTPFAHGRLAGIMAGDRPGSGKARRIRGLHQSSRPETNLEPHAVLAIDGWSDCLQSTQASPVRVKNTIQPAYRQRAGRAHDGGGS